MKTTFAKMVAGALLIAGSMALAGCSPASNGEPMAVAAMPPPSAEASPAQQGTQYRISKQDTLEIAVYGVAELSRSLEVDGSGQINMPLLGGVMAAGKTVRELEAELAKKLGARYLQSPQVSVYVKDAVGQRVTIDGAVKQPGVISAKGETTLLRAIAQAQGFSETADLGGVIIFRQTAQGRVAARFDVAAIRAGRAPDPPVYGGDTIVVDESGAKATWKQFREAMPVAGLFRIF